jgi:hypothetical protein
MVWLAAEEFTDSAVPEPDRVMELPLTVNAVVVVLSKLSELMLSEEMFWLVGR